MLRFYGQSKPGNLTKVAQVCALNSSSRHQNLNLSEQVKCR